MEWRTSNASESSEFVASRFSGNHRGLDRKVANCALCDDYACEKISNFIANVPPAKANLEEVRRTRQM